MDECDAHNDGRNGHDRKRAALLRHFAQLAVLATALLLPAGVRAVTPLDNTAEFLVGDFASPAGELRQGAAPSEVATLPRASAALPAGVWLQFQAFGRGRYAAWSAQMRVDEQGHVILVAHRGDATPALLQHPAWPAKPAMTLDDAALRALRTAAATFATSPAYRGHPGSTTAPVFFFSLLADGEQREFIADAWQDDFIVQLRRISSLAHDANPRRARRR